MDDLEEELDALERILCGQKEPDSLDFRLLRRLTGNFSDDRRIGEGGCGEVYKGELPNGKLIAVKKLKRYHIIDEKMFLREVDSMIKVRHQNIVRFLGYCSEIKEKAVLMDGKIVMAEEREKLLCFPYISNGSLDKHLTDELRGFEWHTRYQIIKGICDGLLHLHKEKGIMHMDLKPANILLGDQMVPKITDFGVSRIDGKTQITSAERIFSRGHAAPEYIDTGVRSWKSDIYSLGVIMTELVTGSRKIPNTTKVLRRWRHRWNKSSKHTPLLYLQVKKCLELAVSCQEINPVKRPYIMDIVRELNNIDSWDGQIKESLLEKIISSSDDMLGIEPLELHFTLAHNKKQISCSIELTNDTDYYMAFKIATTSLLPFSILPDKGIAAPQSKCTTIIILSAEEMTPLLHNLFKEEFIVQSTKIDESLTAVDITEDMFNDEGANSQEKICDGDKVVDEVNLTVLFDEMLHEEHQRVVEKGSLVTSSQCRSIKLEDNMRTSKISRLIYTNSGLGIMALTSSAVHLLWKWKWPRRDRNSGKATTSVSPTPWQPLNGIFMINDTTDNNPEEAAHCFALSKNDSYVISASGGKISLFNMMTFNTIRTFMPAPPAATFLAFYPQDNNIIAIGMDDSTIQIYNVRIDEVKRKLRGHSKRITGLAFSNVLNVLVSSGADAQLCVWNTDGWEKQKNRFLQIPSGRQSNILDIRVQFHQDQMHFLVVHETQIAIYETTKLEPVKQWPVPENSPPITDATFSCDSQLIYAIFMDATVGIFNASSLRLQSRILPASYLPPNISPSVHPVVVAAHPAEASQFALGLIDGSVFVLEPLESERKWGNPPPVENGSASNLSTPPRNGASSSDQPER